MRREGPFAVHLAEGVDAAAAAEVRELARRGLVGPSLLAPGVDVLLGSDSLLTGAGTLLDELRCARELGALSDERLVDAVGRVAARRLALPEPSLEVGARADLVVLRRPLLEATLADVALVTVDGVPRVLGPALARAAWTVARKARPLLAYGVVRWVVDEGGAPRGLGVAS